MKYLMLIAVILALASGCRYHYDGNCPNGNCVKKTTPDEVAKEVVENQEFVALFVKPITSDLVRVLDKAKLVKILDEKYGKRLYVIYASTPKGAELAKQAELTKFPAIVVVKKVNGALTVVRKLEGFTSVEEAEKFLEDK